MRLLHTGDLHLDSAFCAYGARDAEKQREAGRELLKRIFDCARDEDCEMILISGDLFDTKFVTPESAELFCSLVESCDVPVVLSPGNHDFYFEDSFYARAQKRLGDKLTLFTSPELQVLDFDELGVRVYGYAFTGLTLQESPLESFELPEDNGYIKLLCAHADISSPVSRYAPVTLAQIERLGFDYAALGHIHNKANETLLNGKARYCGFAEGRSFDELGEGGVWIVDVDTEGCDARRRILSRRSFYLLDADMPEHDGVQELTRRLCEVIKTQNYPSGSHLRLTLVGNAYGDSAVGDALCENIRELSGLDYLEIYDETLPLLDGEYLERDTTLRGELYRALLPRLMGESAEERRIAIKALRIGLAAIDGKNIFDAGK